MELHNKAVLIEPESSEHITIDFETRSKCNIRAAGVWRYSEDPSTQMLCVAYRIGTGPEKLWKAREDKTFPQDLREAIESGMILEAHNAEFERAIWKNVLTPQFGAPEVPIAQWRCSAAKAAYCAIPRALGDAVEAMGLPARKDGEGKRIMMQLARPRRLSENNSKEFWEPEDVPDKFEKLDSYCVDDIKAESGLSKFLPSLSDEEQELWFLDQKINTRGFCIDVENVQKILWCIGRLQEKMDTKTQEITKGELRSVRQRDAFLRYFANYGYYMLDATGPTVQEWLKRDDLPEVLQTLLKHREIQSKTTTAKYKSMLDRVCSDNTIKGTLKYHGSHTGRWTGIGVQPQNLPRGTEKDVDAVIEDFSKSDISLLLEKYPNPFEAAASCIRAMIIASPGNTLFCSDFSSIEARVLVWLADDQRALEIFRSDKDIYVDMAAAIYKVPAEEVTEEQRHVGKMAILGLGYGMGWKTFMKNCEARGIVIDESFARTVIRKYRERYELVTGLWSDLEIRAKAAVRNPGKCYGIAGVKFMVKDDFLCCRLPSGRVIRYYKPDIKPKTTSWGETRDTLVYWGVNSYTRKWEEQGTYGGKLTENVTQAIARDFMAEAMLRIDAAGFDIVLTVHDELLAESPMITDPGNLEYFIELMTIVPEWAKGCPIGADGWSGERYRK